MINKEVAPKQSRWFIWAIVALLVSGIGLVGYIMVGNANQDTETAQVLSK